MGIKKSGMKIQLKVCDVDISIYKNEENFLDLIKFALIAQTRKLHDIDGEGNIAQINQNTF